MQVRARSPNYLHLLVCFMSIPAWIFSVTVQRLGVVVEVGFEGSREELVTSVEAAVVVTGWR